MNQKKHTGEGLGTKGQKGKMHAANRGEGTEAKKKSRTSDLGENLRARGKIAKMARKRRRKALYKMSGWKQTGRRPKNNRRNSTEGKRKKILKRTQGVTGSCGFTIGGEKNTEDKKTKDRTQTRTQNRKHRKRFGGEGRNNHRKRGRCRQRKKA